VSYEDEWMRNNVVDTGSSNCPAEALNKLVFMTSEGHKRYPQAQYLTAFFFFLCFRTSLFIILSFVYAKLLVVICIAYVVSEVITAHIPLVYYEVSDYQEFLELSRFEPRIG